MFTQRYFLVLITLATVISISFYATLKYQPQSIYNDLKTRVIGSRLANVGYLPYTHKWNPAKDDIRLLNAHEKPTQIVNGNTVTPTVLLATKWFHELALSTITKTWFWLSYLALFIIFYIFVKQYNYNNKKTLLICFSFLFSLMTSWRMHQLKGQMYIFYALIAVLCIYCYQRNNMILGGLLAGILLALRIPSILLILPLLILQFNKQFFWTCLLSAFALVALSIYVYDISIWQDYFSSLKMYELENAGLIPELNTPQYHYTIPRINEGVWNIYTGNLYSYELWLGYEIPSVQKLLITLHLPSNKFMLGFLYLIFCIGTFLIIKNFHTDFYKKEPLLILFASVLFFSVDFFLPALRFNYNFVQFLLPIAIILIYNIPIYKNGLLLIIIGISMNLIKLFPLCYSTGEFLSMMGVFLIIIQNNKTKNEIFKHYRSTV